MTSSRPYVLSFKIVRFTRWPCTLMWHFRFADQSHGWKFDTRRRKIHGSFLKAQSAHFPVSVRTLVRLRLSDRYISFTSCSTSLLHLIILTTWPDGADGVIMTALFLKTGFKRVIYASKKTKSAVIRIEVPQRCFLKGRHRKWENWCVQGSILDISTVTLWLLLLLLQGLLRPLSWRGEAGSGSESEADTKRFLSWGGCSCFVVT